MFALGSVSTGGPTVPALGASSLDLIQQIVIGVFCLLGALPFTVTIRIMRLRHTEMLELPEIAAVIGLFLVSAAVLTLSMVWTDGFSWAESLRKGPLLALFVQTTSGYVTLDVNLLSDSTLAVLIPFMAVGGGIGSTAGGFKGLRLLIGLSVIRAAIRNSRMPAHAHHKPTLLHRVIGDEFTHDALQVTFLFLITVGATWIVFLIFGYESSDSLLLVVSAAANAGYASGIVPQSLPAGLKLLLVLVMILGRLELLAVLVFLSPGNWFGRRRHLK